MKVIDTKAEGGTVRRHKGGRAPEKTKVVDLVARLKESLRSTRTTKTGKRKRRAA